MNELFGGLCLISLFFQVDIAAGTVTTIAGTGEKGTDLEGGNIGTAQVCENRCSPSAVLSLLFHVFLSPILLIYPPTSPHPSF